MSRLRDIRHGEQGIAMVVAMGVLATLLVLTATVVSAANLTGASQRLDDRSKRAFEAAEAGLQATLYRLNMLAPARGNCIGGPSETVQAPTGPACAPYTQSLGNGATFTSWTTPELSQAGTCAGLQVGVTSTIAERCITSAGTVDGVTRRVQTRVASYAAAPLFPLAGLVGLHSVNIANNAHVVGGTGSNGQVTVNNNGSTTSTTLGPSAPNVIVGNNGSAGVVARRTSAQGPFSFTPVDPGSSVTTSDDVRLTNAFATPRGTPSDSYSGSVTWNAVTRTLSLGNNASVTLGGALYNFCSLSLSNNSTITLATGARTAIYIDSPERSGSGCPATSGTFSMSNNTSMINNSPPAAGSTYAHDPTALQLYVVGKTGAVVNLANNSAFYGTVYAPTSTINVSNNAGTWGAVTGNDITMNNNSTFTGDYNATNITTNAAGLYFRSAWRECLATAPTSDPGSGC